MKMKKVVHWFGGGDGDPALQKKRMVRRSLAVWLMLVGIGIFWLIPKYTSAQDKKPEDTKAQIALDLLDRGTANGLRFGWVYFGIEFASDPQFLKDLERRGYRYVAPRPALRDGDRAFGGAGPWITNGEGQEPVARVARSGDESLRSFEQRRREIGLDHFEVRTYRSLLRHLALSTASLLFLEERARRLGSRKDRPSIKSRAL